MSEELKPCAHCGSIDINDDCYYGDLGFVIECNNCGVIAPSFIEWNARHIPDGYKLIPIDPTKKQLLAGMQFYQVL